MPSGVRELRIDTGGVTLAVRQHDGGTPPLLALHGLGSTGRWWDLVALRMAPAHRVVAPDLRGHGASDKPDHGYGFDEVVGDLRRLGDALGLGRLVVAGHSWGASVALAFAAAEPERTLAAVCVDGGATDLKAYFGPDWSVAERTMRPPDLGGIAADSVRGWASASQLAEGSDDATAAEILLANFEPDHPGATTVRPRLTLGRHMEIAKALYDLDPDALMARIRCPVLFLPAGHAGAEDSRKVAAMERAGRVLGARATVAWIDGGHDLPVQRPDQVAKAIGAFLSERLPRPR